MSGVETVPLGTLSPGSDPASVRLHAEPGAPASWTLEIRAASGAGGGGADGTPETVITKAPSGKLAYGRLQVRGRAIGSVGGEF